MEIDTFAFTGSHKSHPIANCQISVTETCAHQDDNYFFQYSVLMYFKKWIIACVISACASQNVIFFLQNCAKLRD